MTDVTRPLDVICPMHALIAPDGRLRHAGPTLRKLRPDAPLIGQVFFDVFEVTRPQSITSLAHLTQHVGRKLHLQFRDSPPTTLKGVLTQEPGGDGLLINLSFGISILDAVKDYALTSADFAPTDLTIEMLYLVEAKSAAMSASRRLNLRLQGAKLVAEEQALTDVLTGLQNRRGLQLILDKLLARQTGFALLHVDLDFFKQVNDTLGHDAGDHVLQQAARIMREETRDRDVVARVGGDEFVLVLEGPPPADRIHDLATRLIARLQQPVPFNGADCRISGSIGSVCSTDYADPDVERLIKDADVALYASKNDGRGRHTAFSALPTAKVEPAASAHGDAHLA